MNDIETNIAAAEVKPESPRSTVSTEIMANTEVSNQNMATPAKKFEPQLSDLEISPYPNSISNASNNNNASSKSAMSKASKEMKKERSLLDRLTIINVEASSSKRKKGRRKSHSRNEKPLPQELLLRDGMQDSISMIPDCFTNSFSYKDEETELKPVIQNPRPVLFTFDLVPSVSEDLASRFNGDDSVGGTSEGNGTTDANFGEDDYDDISGIFDELEERDVLCVKAVEDKYFTNNEDSNPFKTKEMEETNAETLAALSKLELHSNEMTKTNAETVESLSKLGLHSRTRTDSTAILTEISSNDTSIALVDKESKRKSQSSQLATLQKDKTSLVAQAAHEEIQLQASSYCTFNVFSMFDFK
jgi:hypothetical protein